MESGLQSAILARTSGTRGETPSSGVLGVADAEDSADADDDGAADPEPTAIPGVAEALLDPWPESPSTSAARITRTRPPAPAPAATSISLTVMRKFSGLPSSLGSSESEF